MKILREKANQENKLDAKEKTNESNIDTPVLNSTMKKYKDNDTKNNISYKDSMLIVRSIDAVMARAIDFKNSYSHIPEGELRDQINQAHSGITVGIEPDSGEVALLDRHRLRDKSIFIDTISSKEGVEFLYSYVKNAFEYKKELLEESLEELKEGTVSYNKTKRNIDLLAWTLENFGDTKNIYENKEVDDGGVISYHLMKSEFFELEDKERILDKKLEDIENEDTDLINGREGDINREGNKVSVKERASKEIIYIIKSLFQRKAKGRAIVKDEMLGITGITGEEFVNNELGFPQLAAFDETWNRLVISLADKLTIDNMLESIKNDIGSYPQFKDLLVRLGDNNSLDDKTQEILTKFHKTFNNSYTPLIQLSFNMLTKDVNGNRLENPEYKVKVGNVSSYYRKVGLEWSSNFFNIVSETNGRLDIKSILKEYTRDRVSHANRSIALKNERAFFSALGIELADNKAIDDYLMNKFKGTKKIYDALEFLSENDIPVETIDDIFSPIYENGVAIKSPIYITYRELQQVNARYSPKYNNMQVMNANGDIVFEHQLNNSLTVKTNTINNTENYYDLINIPYMSDYDINKNPFLKDSIILNSIYDLDTGDKKRDKSGKYVKLNLNNISGIQEQVNGNLTENGEIASEADGYSKFILDFHTYLKYGVIESMRHADKKTSYSMGSSYIESMVSGINNTNQRLYFPILSFFKNFGGKMDDVLPNERLTAGREASYRQVMKYLSAELERINKAKEMLDDKSIVEYDFEYLERGLNFHYFDKVLSDDLKNKLKELDSNLTLLNHISEDEELSQEIYADIDKYFNHRIKVNIEQYNKVKFVDNSLYQFILKEAEGFWGEESKSREITIKNIRASLRTDRGKERLFEKLMEAFTINQWVHNIETTFMSYGDLANYRGSGKEELEFNKRNAGAGSTGNGYRIDEGFLKYINQSGINNYYKALLSKGEVSDGAYVNRYYDGTLNTAVLEDIKTPSMYYDEYLEFAREYVSDRYKLTGSALEDKAKELVRKYKEVKDESDAQAYISFDSYRMLRISNDTWDWDNQEPLYRKIINGEDIDINKVNTFFPVIKNQYWGSLKTNPEYLPLVGFHKYSMMPLIPNMYKEGSNLDKLHKKMMKEGIDYVTFQSGSKMGTVFNRERGLDKMYDNVKTRTLNENTPFVKNVIYTAFLKDQLEIAPKYKKEIVFSTQLRSLIEDGYIENGIPVDYMKGEDTSKRQSEWNKLKEKEKLKASPYYSLVKEYEVLLAKLTERKKDSLLREANMELNEEGEIKGKVEDLMNFIKKQLELQDISQHELDNIGLTVDKELKNDLSLVLSSDKIEKMLNAIVTNRLVKQKITGEHLVLAASTGFETERNIEDINKINSDKEAWRKAYNEYGTNGLPFYRFDKEKGEMLPMGVKISLQGKFKHLLKDKDVKVLAKKEEIDLLDALNILIRDESWLSKGDNRKMITMIGVRIPVQSTNSMEYMQVYEFLPESTGNILIPPSELVVKAGSGYGVDKMTVSFPSISNVGGQPYYDKASNEKLDKDSLIKEEKNLLSEIKKVKDNYKVDKTNIDSINELNRQIDTLLNSIEFIQESEYYKEGKNIDELNDSIFKRLEQIEDLEIKREDEYNKVIEQSREFIDKDLEETFARKRETLSELYEKLYEVKKKRISIGVTGVENSLVNTISKMIAHPINKFKLIRPNDTDMVKPFADELRSSVSDYNPFERIHDEDKYDKKYSNTSVLETQHNINVHISNSVGMRVLGMGAKENTSNIKYNRANARLNHNNLGIKINPSRIRMFMRIKNINEDIMMKYEDVIKATLSSMYNTDYSFNISTIKSNYEDAQDKALKAQLYLITNYQVQEIHLPHNKLKDEAGNDIISLSHLYDANGVNSISETIGQMINGWVDVAKDDWIFYIQGNKELSSPLMFMVEAGVPLDYAIYFTSNKLVREYAELQRIYSSVFSPAIYEEVTSRNYAKTLAKDKLFEKYDIDKNYTNNIINGNKENFTVNNLKQSITGDVSELDKAILLHFLQIEEMDRASTDVKLKTSLDTDKSKTLFEAKMKIKDIEKLENQKRMADDIIDNLKGEYDKNGNLINPTSSLSSFFIQDFQLKIWKNLFPFKLQEDINDYLFDYISSKEGYKYIRRSIFNGQKENYANGWKSNLLNYLFQNELLVKDAKDKKFYGYNIKDKELPESDFPVEFNGKTISIDLSQLNKYRSINTFGGTINKDTFSSPEEFKLFLLHYAISDEKSNVRRINRALDSSYNFWKLFRSPFSYAKQYNSLLKRFPKLKEHYVVFNNIISLRDRRTGYSNLGLSNPKMDKEEMNIIHEELKEMMNKEFKEEVELSNKEKEFVANYLKRLPMVAFMQSGQNSRGIFSLIRVVPDGDVNKLLNIAVDKFNSKSEDAKKDILLDFTNKFNNAHQTKTFNRGRGVNYYSTLSPYLYTPKPATCEKTQRQKSEQ